MNTISKSYNARPKSISWLKLIICLVVTFGIGQLSMWLSGATKGHLGVNISSLTPPPYLIGIVWSVLYILIGASLYTVLDHPVYTIRSHKLKNTSLTLFLLQFALLILLPFLLFGAHLYMLTFVTTSLITAFVAALAIINLKITPTASLLLLPYLAWLFFEMYLSLIIVLNNF